MQLTCCNFCLTLTGRRKRSHKEISVANNTVAAFVILTLFMLATMYMYYLDETQPPPSQLPNNKELKTEQDFTNLFDSLVPEMEPVKNPKSKKYKSHVNHKEMYKFYQRHKHQHNINSEKLDNVNNSNQQDHYQLMKLKIHVVEDAYDAMDIWYEHLTKTSQTRQSLPFSLIRFEAPEVALDSQENTLKHMTTDDNLIKSAVQWGIVAHSQRIFPSWSKQIGLQTTEYVGLWITHNKFTICQCPVQNSELSDTCHLFLKRNPNSKIKHKEISNRRCQRKKGPYLSIKSVEDGINQADFPTRLINFDVFSNSVVSKLSSPISHVNDFILDINEDYFGVQNPLDLFKKFNITNNNINWLSTFLRRTALFVATDAIDEMQTDGFFNVIIKTILRVKNAFCFAIDDKSQMCLAKIMQTIKKDKILNHWMFQLRNMKKHRHVPRNWATNMKKLIEYLAQHFTAAQLRLLSIIGICSQSSSNSQSATGKMLRLIMPNQMSHLMLGTLTLCLGQRSVGTKVPEFVDTTDGINTRINRLKAQLFHLPKPPSIITITRNARAGRTPKSQQSFIEEKLLSMLRSLYKNVAVDYDSHLFYNSEGWTTTKMERYDEFQQYIITT